MRRFEFSEGSSSKFWEIRQDGADLRIRWGRIGTQGQSQVNTFADVAKAAAIVVYVAAAPGRQGFVTAASARAGAVLAAQPV